MLEFEVLEGGGSGGGGGEGKGSPFLDIGDENDLSDWRIPS